MEGAVSEAAYDDTTTTVAAEPVVSLLGDPANAPGGDPPVGVAGGGSAVRLEPGGRIQPARHHPAPDDHGRDAVGAAVSAPDPVSGDGGGWPYRQRSTVTGLVTDVRAWTGSRMVALEAVVVADRGALSVVWMGRRSLGGVRPGRRLTISGTVGQVDGRPVVFNPRYELLPNDGGPTVADLTPADPAPAGKPPAPAGNGD